MATETVVATTEVKTRASASINWRIQNWGSLHDLMSHKASCVMNIDNGQDQAASPIQLRFFFAKKIERRFPDRSSFEQSVQYYLPMCVELLSAVQDPLPCQISVYQTNPSALIHKGVVLRKNQAGRAMAILYEVYLCTETYMDGQLQYIFSPDRENSTDQEFTITASIISIDNSQPNLKLEEASASGVDLENSQASIYEDLKTMYGAEDNLSDLDLKTKDPNITLSAHRFILAARSPVFRRMIEKEIKKSNFSGTIDVSSVNPKPLTVVLYWMYSGELHENAMKVMEEVVEIGVKFEIPDLLKSLDKKLITICTTENMFQLAEMARKNGMKTAVAAISAFIKENI